MSSILCMFAQDTMADEVRDDSSSLLPAAATEALFAIGSILVVLALKEWHYRMGRGSAKKRHDKPVKECKNTSDHGFTGSDGARANESLPQQRQPSATPTMFEAAKHVANRQRQSELLQALAKKRDIYRATKTLQKLEEQFGDIPLSDYSSVITMCAKCNDPGGAHGWLQRVQEVGMTPTNICFNAVINAYAKQGLISQAIEVAESMKGTGLEFDTVTYNTFIDAGARAGDAGFAQRWMQNMLEDGVRASVVSFGSVMRACAQAGKTEDLDHWFKHAGTLGIELNMICFSAIINAFAKNDDVASANAWIGRMIEYGLNPSVHCYTGLIGAVLAKGDLDGAEDVMEQMLDVSVEPDSAVYSMAIAAAAKAGCQERAQAWATQAIDAGCTLSRFAEMALIAAGIRVPARDGDATREHVPSPTLAHTGGDLGRQDIAGRLGRRACVGRRFVGTIKEFISCKFGYISCNETFAVYKRDVFLSAQDNPEQLAKGQRVSFTLVLDKRGGLPRAFDIKVHTE